MLTFNQHNNNNKRQSFFEKRTFTTGLGPLFPWWFPIPSENTDPIKHYHLMKEAIRDSILASAKNLAPHEEFDPKAAFNFLVYKVNYKENLASSDLDILAIMYAGINVSIRIAARNQNPVNPMYPEDMSVRDFLEGLVALNVFNCDVLAINLTPERIANGYAFISKFIGGEHIEALKQFTKNNKAITNVEKNQLATFAYFLDVVIQLMDFKNNKDFATHVLYIKSNTKLGLVVLFHEALQAAKLSKPLYLFSSNCCFDRLMRVGKDNANLADAQQAFFEHMANSDTKKSLFYRERVAKELLQYKIARLSGKRVTDQEFNSYSSTTQYVLENGLAAFYKEIDKEIAAAASTQPHKRVRSHPFCNSCIARVANKKNVNADLERLLKPLVDDIAAFLKLNFTESDEKTQCALTLKWDGYKNKFFFDVMSNVSKGPTSKPKGPTSKPKGPTSKPKGPTSKPKGPTPKL